MFESAHILAAEMVETKSTIGTIAIAAIIVIVVVTMGFGFFLTGSEKKITPIAPDPVCSLPKSHPDV